MWIILGTVAGITIAFCLIRIFGVGSSPLTSTPDTAKLSLVNLTSVPTSVRSVLEDVIGHSINATTDTASTPSSIQSMSSKISKLLEPTTPADRDPLLRIFDQL